MLQLCHLLRFGGLSLQHDVLEDSEVLVDLVQVVDLDLEVVVLDVLLGGPLAVDDFRLGQVASQEVEVARVDLGCSLLWRWQRQALGVVR